jgi:hypothetical protein
VALTAEREWRALHKRVRLARINGASLLELALLDRYMTAHAPVPPEVPPDVGVRSCTTCGIDQIHAGASFREGDAPAATVSVSVAAKRLGISCEATRRLARKGAFGPAGRGPRRTWRLSAQGVQAERDRRRLDDNPE